jgi:uncharacterized delta-60 repeat protein
MKRFNLFLGFLFLATELSAQLISPAWVSRYTGTGDNSDVYNKIISDGSGNFIAVGYTVRSGNYKDFLTVKMNSSLDTLWSRTKNGENGGDDEAVSAVVDASGNIYVAGYVDAGNTNDDIYVVKYDSNGNTSWDTSYYSTANAFLDDHPVAIAISPSGNIVIAGWSEQGTWASSSNDFLILSFDSNGSLQWSRRYGRFVNQRDEATAMAIDANNYIYVTGRSSNGSDDDFVTLKLDPATGNDIWSPVKIFSGGNGNDRPTAMSLTSAGDIVVTGRSRGTNDDDYRTIAYSSAGNVLWSKSWAGVAGHDRSTALVIDASDNVYVAGESDRDASTAINYDVSLVKYNSAGTFVWQRYWSGAALNDDVPSAITTDNTGNVVVCGITDADATTAIKNDWFILMYDASGNSPWQKTVNGSRSIDDEANSLICDVLGNTYVVGSINNNTTQNDAGVIVYDSNGNIAFNKSFNGEGDFNDNCFSMVQDANGNTFAAGYTYNELNNRDIFISKINASGITLASNTFQGIKGDDDELESLVYDSNGYLYACGYTKVSGQKSDFITIKYSLNLDTIWTRTYNYAANQADKAISLGVDASGNVYVTGRSDSDANDSLDNRDIVTIKYDANGNQQWLQRFNGSGNLNDEAIKLVLDNTGKVFIAGYTSNATDKDIILISYEQANGNSVSGFPVIFNSASGKNDEAGSLVTDASGNIYIGGFSEMILPDVDYVLLKYSNNGGSPVWTRFNNGSVSQEDLSTSICLDSQGNIISTGKSDIDSDPLLINYDYVTVKYDNNGNPSWSNLPDYDGAAGEDDVPSAVATDSNNNIYVTGQSQEGTVSVKNKNIMSRLYAPDGSLVLYADYDGLSGSDGGNALLISPGYFYVAGFSEDASNTQKDIVVLKYDVSVGIDEAQNNTSSSYIYPNPVTASSKIIVGKSISPADALTLKVYDAIGNEVIHVENLHAPTLSLNSLKLTPALYHYQLMNGTSIVTKGKFAVTR